MSNAPKTPLKVAKPMTRKEELVSKLTNKHAQGRAVAEWHSLIELAKMDGTTVAQALDAARDILTLRQVMALEAIAGEMHAINQGVANFNILQEMLHPELFDKEDKDEAPAVGEPSSETAEDPELPESEPDSNQIVDPMTSGGTPVNEPLGDSDGGTATGQQVTP